MQTRETYKEDYLKEVLDIFEDGDTIKYMGSTIRHFNGEGCILSEYDIPTRKVFYY